jgi:hypothetical protein
MTLLEENENKEGLKGPRRGGFVELKKRYASAASGKTRRGHRSFFFKPFPKLNLVVVAGFTFGTVSDVFITDSVDTSLGPCTDFIASLLLNAFQSSKPT